MKLFQRLAVAGCMFCAWATAVAAAPTHEVGRLQSGDRTRHYLLYVPDSYEPLRATPLVISLHGFFERPRHLQQMSGWSAEAEAHGFVVVYPRGTGSPLRWNTRAAGGDTAAVARDVQFIVDLIDALDKDLNIDRRRVFANGLSNGGGMSHVLACQLADRVAAIGGVAGAYPYPWGECQPSRPMPVIAFHGTADPIVPYAGGAAGRGGRTNFGSISSWALGWARRNGCSPAPKPLERVGQVSGIRYGGCENGAEVELYMVEDGGHSWPGGQPMPVSITGTTTQDVSATALMWEFFQRVTATAIR